MICHHGGNSGTSRKNQKTYGRFLGMIFWERCARRRSLRRKGLQNKSPRKPEKPQKKVSFFRANPPFFCQTGPFWDDAICNLLAL
jgi:hypothetical protein